MAWSNYSQKPDFHTSVMSAVGSAILTLVIYSQISLDKSLFSVSECTSDQTVKMLNIYQFQHILLL